MEEGGARLWEDRCTGGATGRPEVRAAGTCVCGRDVGVGLDAIRARMPCLDQEVMGEEKKEAHRRGWH